MPVQGLDRFRQLIQEHQQCTDGTNQLTRAEIQSALAELKPADQIKARELALEAMLKTNLSNDALTSLQSFLGVKHGECSTSEPPSTPGTKAFAVRLMEAQGVNSVGRSQVWKWEAEQCLKTLGYGASETEVREALRTMLATAELTPDALASTRLFVEQNRILSKESLKWPSGERPTDFGELTNSLSEAIESGHRVQPLPVRAIGGTSLPEVNLDTRTSPSDSCAAPTMMPEFQPAVPVGGATELPDVATHIPELDGPQSSVTPGVTSHPAPISLNTTPATTDPTPAVPVNPSFDTTVIPEDSTVPRVDLNWTGPPTPGFAVEAGDTTFEARIKAENLLRNEQSMGRPALHSIMSIGVQLGMEQGRRAVMSSPEVKGAGAQLDAAEMALANGQPSQARQSLVNFIQALQSPSMASPLSSLVQADGTVKWPEGDLPVVMEELEAPMRKLLKDAFHFEQLDPNADIPWTGPRSPMFLNDMPYEMRLSAETARSPWTCLSR